jgi:hypothetical protein
MRKKVAVNIYDYLKRRCAANSISPRNASECDQECREMIEMRDSQLESGIGRVATRECVRGRNRRCDSLPTEMRWHSRRLINTGDGTMMPYTSCAQGSESIRELVAGGWWLVASGKLKGETSWNVLLTTESLPQARRGSGNLAGSIYGRKRKRIKRSGTRAAYSGNRV